MSGTPMKPRPVPKPDGTLPRKNARGPKPGSLTKSFARWVRAQQAATFRVETAEGERTVKGPGPKIPATSGARAQESGRHQALVATLWSLQPEKIEALDEAGNILGICPSELLQPPEDETTDAPDEQEPGHTIHDEDNREERIIKTVAHLISDAWQKATGELTSVIKMQGQYFAEERKHMNGIVMSMDRTLQRVQKIGSSTRVRVALQQDEADGGTEAGEPEGAEDDSMNDMLKQALPFLIKRFMRDEAPTAATNGAAAPPNGKA